jgi:hypothetical protein
MTSKPTSFQNSVCGTYIKILKVYIFIKTPRLEQIELNIKTEMDKDNEFYYIRVNLNLLN